jgi:hypothetical protein
LEVVARRHKVGKTGIISKAKGFLMQQNDHSAIRATVDLLSVSAVCTFIQIRSTLEGHDG